MQSLFKKKTDAPVAPKEAPKTESDPGAPRTAATRGLGSLFGGSKASEPKTAVAPGKATSAIDKPMSRIDTLSKR
jgi:hypothetical protein